MKFATLPGGYTKAAVDVVPLVEACDPEAATSCTVDSMVPTPVESRATNRATNHAVNRNENRLFVGRSKHHAILDDSEAANRVRDRLRESRFALNFDPL